MGDCHLRGGNVYTITYDSSAVRKSKTVDGVTTNFTYVDGKLIRQSDGTNIWWFYYDSDGSLLAMEYNDSMYFYQFDGLGNIVGLVDINGDVVASYVYDPWGRITSRSGSMNKINPFKFKGYYYDDETQFYYLMSRYYDPIVGRFINADGYYSTGQNVVGYNMYAYCLNKPIIMKDNVGNAAIYVVDYTETEGLPVVGHSRLYLEDFEGNWYMTEYTGTKKTNAKVYTYPVGQQHVDAVLVGSESTHAIYIEGDFSESVTAAKEAKGKNLGGYNLLTNNCLDYSQHILEQGNPSNSVTEYAIENIKPVAPISYEVTVAYATIVGKMADGVANMIWKVITDVSKTIK